MEITVKDFSQLTTSELYEILKMRCAVFIVEQNCPYQDIDGTDEGALHIFIREGGSMTAYLRVFEKDAATAHIGRVLTLQRGRGYGKAVLRAGIKAARETMGKSRIYLEAQTYAVPFYEKEGFESYGEEFLEDGIPHIRMMLDMNSGK